MTTPYLTKTLVNELRSGLFLPATTSAFAFTRNTIGENSDLGKAILREKWTLDDIKSMLNQSLVFVGITEVLKARDEAELSEAINKLFEVFVIVAPHKTDAFLQEAEQNELFEPDLNKMTFEEVRTLLINEIRGAKQESTLNG